MLGVCFRVLYLSGVMGVIMKASDLFIQALENEGVEYIFGIPGEENLDLLESLRKSKQIRLILTRHEAYPSVANDDNSGKFYR